LAVNTNLISRERTRPRVLIAAPRRNGLVTKVEKGMDSPDKAFSLGKVRDDEGIIASTRGELRSPEGKALTPDSIHGSMKP